MKSSFYCSATRVIYKNESKKIEYLLDSEANALQQQNWYTEEIHF